jgi:hypothetical protein
MSDPSATDPIELKLLLAVVPGVLGFVGSWLGAQVALSNFKQQRAFDKKLDWYDRAGRSLLNLAQDIEVAATFQAEKGTDPEDLEDAWSDVQQGHIELESLAYEAGFYGSSVAVDLMDKIRKVVEKAAEGSEAFDPKVLPVRRKQDALNEIIDLSAKLRKVHARLVLEGRSHLGIDGSNWFGKLKRYLLRTKIARARATRVDNLKS